MFGFTIAVLFAVFQGTLGSCTQEGYTYPDDTDCRNYYICRGGSPVLMHCPPLLYWNCYDSTCVRARQGACCPNDNTLKIGGINVPCINGMKIPDVMTCNKYFQCVNKVFQPYYCSMGQRFDPILMRCRVAWYGACATPRTTTTSTTTTGITGATGTGGTTSTTSIPSGIKIPNIFNCNQYYTYQNFGVQTVTCPDNQYYNCWQRKCSSTKSPLCCSISFPGQTISCPTNNVLNSKPLSCFKYYKCVDNKVTTQSCPWGQAFDAWTSTCKDPWTARCSIKPGLTVCQAGLNGAIPFGSVNFNISIACPKW